MMRKVYFCLLINIFLMISCTSIKVHSSSDDSTLFYEQSDQGQIHVFSMQSAQKIKITRQELKEDTLLITYKRGLFRTPDNILKLDSNVKYLKMANEYYLVTQNGNTFNIEPIK